MLALAAALATVLNGPYLEIRRGKADMTPDERLPLGGYTARQGAIDLPGGDHLFARTELFFEGDEKIAVVSVEMLTVPDSLVRAVQARIPKDLHLFMAATHTHCAPDSQMLNDRMTFAIPGVATFRKRWLDWYAAAIAQSVNSAESGTRYVPRAIQAVVTHVDLNHGRRTGALPDKTATDIVAWQGENPRPNELFFSYAAHPVFYDEHENRTRGDWPGAFMATHEGLVLQGALGDVSPKAEGSNTEEKISNFIRTVDNAENSTRSISRMDVWKAGDPVRFLQQPIVMDPTLASPAFLHDYKLPKAIADPLVKKFSPPSAFVTAFRIGRLAVVGIPGEPMSHLGRRIRDYGWGLGFSNVLVISHVNGWIGYILGPTDYARGGYEASLSFNGDQEGEHVVAAAEAALRKLAKG